jgi:hypothetical protein
LSQPHAISLLLKTASDLAFTHTKEAQIQYLKIIFNEAIRDILSGAYHPGVVWLVPEDISYVPAEASKDYESKLYREYKKLYVFCKGGPNIEQNKRNRLFVQLLESVHPDDAVMLVAMTKKYLPYPGLNYDLIYEAFPGMLPPKPVISVEPPVILPPDLDNMSKQELELFFKNKFGQAIPEKEPRKEREINPNKGKKWYHNGVKSFLCTDGEAEKNGWILGRLPKK